MFQGGPRLKIFFFSFIFGLLAFFCPLFFFDGKLNALVELRLSNCITAYWSFLWFIIAGFGVTMTFMLLLMMRPLDRYGIVGSCLPFMSYALMSVMGPFDLASEFFLVDMNISKFPYDWYWLNPQPRGCVALPFGLTGNPWLFTLSALRGYKTITLNTLILSSTFATLIIIAAWTIYAVWTQRE